ncbi:MAG: four helix bundle protein [Alistipes sp.]|nr:four helix bundle protein [Alistipes senegalensis]MCM1250622.1 four helix bundle protein [Alistipes sp.]
MRVKADNIVLTKSLNFAIRIVNLYKYVIATHNEYILSKQLLKSGTSVGANIREALRGQSPKDFTAKMHIALKEAYETEYWLELLFRTDYLKDDEFDDIFRDCRELTNLLASIVKTMKEKEKIFNS